MCEEKKSTPVPLVFSGDGNDTVEDKLGNNRVIFNGNAVNRFFRQPDGTLKTADGKIAAAMAGTDLILTDTATNATLTLNQNFQEGDFGIHFVDAPVDPVIGLTLTGDLSPADTDPDITGIQAEGDAQGNITNGTAQPYGDIMGGSAGNDHILSGKDNDDVGGGAGDDWIEGGADSDIVAGEEGNDRLYGNVRLDTATAIANGSTGAATNLKGDWLAGGSGDDTLVAGADNDVLSGGAGSDLLIAGAGDDNIWAYGCACFVLIERSKREAANDMEGRIAA